MVLREQLKNELGKLYAAPGAQRKEVFLEELERKIELSEEGRSISFWGFLRQQIPYIRKWNWLFAAAVFILIWFCVKHVQEQAVSLISAFGPFLALAAVSEGSRSMQYGMEEFELSARFPMKVIVMARLSILGMCDFILLLAGILIVGTHNQAEGNAAGLVNGAVMLIPYLLTVFLNLLIVRKVHGRESIYLCTGTAVLVCGLNLAMTVPDNFMYSNLSNTAILLLFFAVCLLTGRECMRFIKQSEEYVWN